MGVNKEGINSYGNPGVVGLGGGCLVLGAAWGHHWGHMGWVDAREGTLEWGATRKECIPMGILGLDRGCLVLGTSLGTRGMGGHQGRDAGVGLNKVKMYFYGNLGAVGLGRGSAVLGTSSGHEMGHMGCGDNSEGTPEWGSARKECIPMGTLRLWGWAGGAWRWGHPGGDTEGSEVVVGGGG